MECSVCKKPILLNLYLEIDRNWWGDVQPETNYWNVKRKEVYCSADCSLKAHTEINTI